MRPLLFAALGLCLAAPAAAAYEDEGPPEETAVSTEAARPDDDEGALVQESDEDLAAFVTDYVRKDIQLKGAFFLEDKYAGKVLKLELASVEPKAAAGENGARSVTVVFREPAGKKLTALFWLQGGPWGGLDIFKIELKGAKRPAELKPAAPPKKKEKKN